MNDKAERKVLTIAEVTLNGRHVQVTLSDGSILGNLVSVETRAAAEGMPVATVCAGISAPQE